MRREVDEDDEAAPWKEQENWEADQIKKASMKVGSKDKVKQVQQYEFVFEDQIDFIKDMALAGDVVSSYSPLRCFLIGTFTCSMSSQFSFASIIVTWLFPYSGNGWKYRE